MIDKFRVVLKWGKALVAGVEAFLNAFEDDKKAS